MRNRLLVLGLLLSFSIAGGSCAGGGDQGQSELHSSSPGDASAAGGRPSVTRRLLGLPALPSRASLPGYLMIADRDNNRIIVVSPRKRVVWQFPSSGDLREGQTFAGPDDAFLTPSGRSIITNEEFADTIAEIRLAPHPRIAFEYGHSDVPGSGPGYLSHPDDAYQLPGGLISVADIINCRVVFINHAHRVVRSIGEAGNCAHDPPASISQPNGDTPLPDGGVLVTEIGGWVDRFDRKGRLRWSTEAPTAYPSDAQLLPNGNVLVAGFDTPGQVDVITPGGRVVWEYGPASGAGALDRPSLAIPIGGGLIAVTDDWRHRVVVIDRPSKRIVWQYGHLDQPGSGPGYLNKPDGLELIR